MEVRMAAALPRTLRGRQGGDGISESVRRQTPRPSTL